MRGDEEGNFTLGVSSRHDVCEGALVSLDGEFHQGTTIGAKMELVQMNPDGPAEQRQGAWYAFVGTGDVVEATTCTAAADFNFDTVLAIFSGSSCHNLTWFGFNDDYESFTCEKMSGLSCVRIWILF